MEVKRKEKALIRIASAKNAKLNQEEIDINFEGSRNNWMH
jgi:hypothetical protein